MKIKQILKEDNKYKEEKKLALEQVLNISKAEILLNQEKTINRKEYKKYKKIMKQLLKGIPIQYITKKAYFYGRDYYVNKNVLIPRPETETLVKDTLDLINKSHKTKKLKILDIGTGSGIIAITLYKERKNLSIIATDISKKALKIAKKNQKKQKTHVKFIHTNLYQKIEDKFDVIISNPPYIKENSQEIEKQVLENEPHIALFGGEDGLDYYKKILKNIKQITNTYHIIAFEIGENQSKAIKKLLQEQFPGDNIVIKKDYNGFDRYIYSINTKI